MSLTTTLTLDDELAAKVERERQRRGDSLEETLLQVLRAALGGATPAVDVPRPFVVHPRALGARPGLDIDRIEGLLDEFEGHIPP
jgi:hypothetical protein